MYLIWFLFEIATGGGAAVAYYTDHNLAAIVLAILFVLGLTPILGDGVGEVIGAFFD